MKGKKTFIRDYQVPGFLSETIPCDLYNINGNGQELCSHRPAFVLIHGGGFVGGDKDQFLGMASWLALALNALCVTVRYRLAGAAPCPAPVVDCLGVYQWIWKNQKELGVDPALMFVIGGSPGANIGAMSILADKRMIENFSLDPKLVFQPVNGIFLNGIYDLTDFCERNPKERERVCQFLDRAVWEKELWEEYSPRHHGRSGRNILMLHGSRDEIVPLQQCVDMKQSMETAGGRAWIRSFEDKGHGWFNEAENLYEVLETIEEFVRFRKMEVRKNGN